MSSSRSRSASASQAGPSSSKITCTECDRSFDTTEMYEEHLKVFHQRSRVPVRPRTASYSCPDCDKKFTAPSKRDLHHDAIHKGLKPHVCHICDKAFAYKGDLAKHLVSHSGEKPHVCYICGARFARNYYVKRHIETVHENHEKSDK